MRIEKVEDAEADGSLYLVGVGCNVFVSCAKESATCSGLYFDDVVNKIVFWEDEVDELYLIKQE